MKILWGILIASALCFPGLVRASVSVSEVMYDIEGTDTGREWVEVWNDSSEAIDLSTWKFFEANVAHKITAIGNSQVPVGGYAIIADSTDKFLADNPGFSGLLFDSVFSLGNAGESVSLKDPSDAAVDTLLYNVALGAAGDGNSLQKKEGTWIAALPTPGSGTTAAGSSEPVEPTASQTTQTTSTNETSNSSSYSAHSSQTVATVSYEEPELVVSLGRSRLGFVGAPLTFEAKMKSVKNMPVTARSTYAWSMGDGTKENGQFISHTYEFPGDYIVILNTSSGGVDAVSKVLVKVVSPRLSVRALSEFVEIENLDSHELNLGGFSIETGRSKFIIPEDTLLTSRATIKLSLATMRLQYGDGIVVKNPKGNILGKATAPHVERIASENVFITLPPGMDLESLRERLKIAGRQ